MPACRVFFPKFEGNFWRDQKVCLGNHCCSSSTIDSLLYRGQGDENDDGIRMDNKNRLKSGI